jgi:hypothetical protein
MSGVPVVPARRLPSMLCELPAVLGPSGSPIWPIRPGPASTLPPNLQRLQDGRPHRGIADAAG